MRQPYNATRMTPLVLLITVVMCGLYGVCDYFKVPLWLTVIVMGVFAVFTVAAIERACKPGRWLSGDNGEAPGLNVGYVSGSALQHRSDLKPPEPP
jgi:hypothetical protein